MNQVPGAPSAFFFFLSFFFFSSSRHPVCRSAFAIRTRYFVAPRFRVSIRRMVGWPFCAIGSRHHFARGDSCRREHCRPILFGNWNSLFFDISPICLKQIKGISHIFLSNFILQIIFPSFSNFFFLTIKLASFSIDITKFSLPCKIS